MGEIAKYLRFLINADKEAVITPVTVNGENQTLFESQLTSGQTRRRIGIRNYSNHNSGEIYYGFSAAVTPGTGMPMVSGELEYIPISEDIDLYFVGTSGEIGDVRVIELA